MRIPSSKPSELEYTIARHYEEILQPKHNVTVTGKSTQHGKRTGRAWLRLPPDESHVMLTLQECMKILVDTIENKFVVNVCFIFTVAGFSQRERRYREVERYSPHFDRLSCAEDFVTLWSC